jgi:ribulose-5-phosphate 4-epimerase/fuculose-1-phosphate aldolase
MAGTMLTAAARQTTLDLTAGLRLLAQGGQNDLAAGFFSARHPEDPALFFASSHGVFWDEVTQDDFGLYSCETRERVDGGSNRLPNFASLANSSAIYTAFPGVNAIIHAHPESVMTICAMDGKRGDILPISEPSFMFYERVSKVPCDFFFTEDYLETVASAFSDDHFCVLMKNHSYLMVGSTIQECYMRSYLLEQSASVQLRVLSSSGGELPTIPSHEECLFHRRSYDGYEGCPPYDGSFEWPALIRQLDSTSDDWRFTVME